MVSSEASMLGFEDAKGLLNELVAREIAAHGARFERDIKEPPPPPYLDPDQLFAHRATQNRITAGLMEIAATFGFDVAYDPMLDGWLAERGYTDFEREKMRHRIERGFLKKAGRAGEDGGDTPPLDYLAKLLRSKGQPISVGGITTTLRLLAQFRAGALHHFAALYGEARNSPDVALSKANALRDAERVPGDRGAWNDPGFASADAIERGEFDVVFERIKPVGVAAAIPSAEAEALGTAVGNTPPGGSTIKPHGADAEQHEYVDPEMEPAETGSHSGQSLSEGRAELSPGSQRILIQPARDPSRSFLSQIESLVETNPGWAKETKRQYRSVGRLLALTVGSDDMADFKQRHIGTYVTNLSKLLKSHGKSEKDKFRSLDELLAMAASVPEKDRKKKVGLDVPTVNRHLTQLGKILKFARLNGFNIGDPATLTEARKVDTRKQGEKKQLFSKVEVRNLLHHPVWTESTSPSAIAGIRSWWSPQLPCLYWVPLIGIYTFGRLAEICYLRVVDIDLDENVFVFMETDERGLKTPGSERKVPIHPELIRLGFLRYVAGIKQSGSELLFPDLRARGAKTPLGALFATLWNYVLDTALPNARREKKTFHSFRHSGNNIMINQGVIDPIREALLGHEGKTTNTRIYGHGLELDPLRKVINEFPSFTDHLQPIF